MDATTTTTPHVTQARSGIGATQAGGRSFVGLFSDLWRETTTLVHKEAELAMAAMSDRVSEVVMALSAMAVGGAIVFAGFLALLAAAIIALARVLPPEAAAWLSPLIVGVVVMVIGFIALSGGKRKVGADNLKPQRTLDSLRRDRQVVKEHLQ